MFPLGNPEEHIRGSLCCIPFLFPLLNSLRSTLRSTLMYPSSSSGVRVNRLPSAALVFSVAWASSVPWAVIHGPVDPLWVVFQALGAGMIPAVAGWVVLWWTKGDRKRALWWTLWTSAVVLTCLICAQPRG